LERRVLGTMRTGHKVELMGQQRSRGIGAAMIVRTGPETHDGLWREKVVVVVGAKQR
jgi:hypothetical protein